MATYEEIEYGSVTFGEVLANVTIHTMRNLSRGLVLELVSPYINDFNKMNHDFMNIHMMRNKYEKLITLDILGQNAYDGGDPSSQSTPAQNPTYVDYNNYMEFFSSVRNGNKYGVATTRVNTENGVENKYFDSKDPDTNIKYSSAVDKNSILFKTQRLLRMNKLKTIISQFHTSGVNYIGQIGSEFGESHGRNLLTKEAESGQGGYTINGYDNPYCRVWTNHYKYDKLSKAMRSNSGLLNYWPGFEWDDTDKGHGVDSTKYGDGENYDYAWRGKHNQDRRMVNSVLDPKTGLVKMTPQYRNGGNENRHTKECMFSIENLAWKDYDPYSFEQALSWEQRGPFGGRIMWFPPYGIEIQETTTAKWNSNDFIGRGEPIYTYINSERTGNLSFYMLTDHPSSIDYASWWDDNNLFKNSTDNVGNSETDYLRYFAGCSNGDSKEVGLNLKPTPLTDEYINVNPPVIEKEIAKKENNQKGKTKKTPPDKTPKFLEFFVFFPNNYSGVTDFSANQDGHVDAIAYLLAGRNAQKYIDENGNPLDIPITIDSTFNASEEYKGNKRFIGYEMGRGAITTSNYEEIGEYIQGGEKKPEQYVPVSWKKWGYRVDHQQPYQGGNRNGTNNLNQIIEKINLKDTNDNKTKYNLSFSGNGLQQGMVVHKDDLYSFAEVAAALYNPQLLNYPSIYQYLFDCGLDSNRVNKLIDFLNQDLILKKVTCTGYATTQGHKKENSVLSKNRADTIVRWLKTNTKLGWNDSEYVVTAETKPVSPQDLKDVNGVTSKLYRCAHCVLEFETFYSSIANTKTDGSQEDDPQEEPQLVGFRYVDSLLRPDGSIWKYYEKDKTVKYYDQEIGSSDNYDEQDTNDIVISETQIKNIFDVWAPQRVTIIKENPRYRGVFNEYGVFLIDYDYSKGDGNLEIQTFIEGQANAFAKGEYIYHKGRFYSVNETFAMYSWDDETVNMFTTEVTNKMENYSKGDLVQYELNGNVGYFQCQHNYIEAHPEYVFNPDDWDKVDTTNITEAISDTYTYKQISDKPYKIKDIIFQTSGDGGKFMLCKNRKNIPTPSVFSDEWEMLYASCYEDGTPGTTWDKGEYVTYNDILWICKQDNTPYTGYFDENLWDRVDTVQFSDMVDIFTKGQIVEYDYDYYMAKNDMSWYVWTDNLRPAMPGLVYDSSHPSGEFDGEHAYGVGDYCRNGDDYYKSKVDFSGKSRELIPFDNSEGGDWIEAPDEFVNKYVYSWELMNLVNKAASIQCFTLEKMLQLISGNAVCEYRDEYNIYECIWKYGETNDLVITDKVNVGVDLLAYVNECEAHSLEYESEDARIKFTEDEEKYLEMLISKHITTSGMDIQTLRKYIILYRIFDGVNKIKNQNGTRGVCTSVAENGNEMREKTVRKDESETEGCSNIWVDRGDGLLIQECNIDYETGGNKTISERFDAETGKGEWNKIRYDQEYHFYRQWMEDHPLMFQKLQEKIKYFNPAFHSMTPEGFNARCTFLQQCTRQGNTKTMSDHDGKTANNLAFGRPPYCVLRLGDFYYQMIVIDNVSFDYNIANGIQWDLNTEGNGVQPMLCKVNISFKFIGGGDITGPVQRLQNAMSFNYYANASFYDNRADRVQYQPTNWATMGGAGNDKIDLEKSYAYVAKRYEIPDINKVSKVDLN